MNLTLEDCNYLLNAIDTHLRTDKNGGVRGAQNAAIVSQKIQDFAKTLIEKDEKPDDA